MLKSFSGVTVKDAEKGLVSAVFSTFDVVDKDGDVTVPGAIADGMDVVISAYAHKSHGHMGGALPVGRGKIRTTSKEAILEGQFFMDTQGGRETFAVVKGLEGLQEWSYSLHDVTAKDGELNGQPVRYLEQIGLIKEVSPVLIGAGVGTRTLATKGLVTLQDQITGATDVVREVIDSAERVVALRAEKGKDLSNVNAESLAGLFAEMDRLKALLSTSAEAGALPEDIPDDIKAIAAELLRRELFSNLETTGA